MINSEKYSSGHPWYYKLGGAVKSPKSIMMEVRTKGYKGYMAGHIENALERVQVVQLMIRLSHDMRILPRKHYADLAEKTDSLARQAQGWLKSASKNSGKSEPERIAG